MIARQDAWIGGALLATLLSCSTSRSSGDDYDMPSLSEGFVRVGADRLYFQSMGIGPPVVFVNGGSMDLRQWDDQVEAFSQLYQVVRFDHRGWGRSSAPTVPYSPEDDLREVLDHLGLQKVILVGSSYGGGVAIDFALAHPERVIKLVLVAPALSGYPWSQTFVARHQAFAKARADEGVDGHVHAILSDPYFVPTALDNQGVAERVNDLLRDNFALYSTDFSLVRAATPPAVARVEEITAPTLVLYPQLDHPDVYGVAALLKSRIERCSLVELANAGHMVHLERPRLFNEHVLAFIRVSLDAE